MKRITRRVKDYEFLWYSERELLKIFADVDIFPTLKERQEEYDQMVDVVKDFLITAGKDAPKKDMWFYEILAEKLLVPGLLKVENHILRLQRLIALTKGSTQAVQRHENFEERKAFAKSYPITQLARSRLELKQSGKNFVALCPLHNEKTPSFYLYTETNTFHCFGCQAGGDVITLTMQLYGIGFTDAVAMLNQDL